MGVRTPLSSMRLRRQKPSHSFGMVRKHDDGSPKAHQGWDLTAPVGTPVFAVADGEVIAATSDTGDYGKSLTIAFLHGGQWYFAFYAHLSAVSCKVGDAVYKGQQVGLTGNTGNASNLSSAEHHLHFEIRTSWETTTGLSGRVDPGELLGYDVYSSRP